MRIERDGQERWLVVPKSPEQLWPQLRTFWERNGFTLTVDNPQTGILETNWAENRAKLPNDLIRSTLGRFIDRLYDSGERDRFRTRLERGPEGTEIYITHRGLEEIYTTPLKDSTGWRPHDNDPQLEAEFLTQLLAKLGGGDQASAREAVAAAPEMPARARALAASSALEVDDSFDRAWRRVGLALDRSGFTVVDRDRSTGVYYVRYADPDAEIGKRDQSWLSKLAFWRKDEAEKPEQYRITVVEQAPSSLVSVQDTKGAPDKTPASDRILALLKDQLK